MEFEYKHSNYVNKLTWGKRNLSLFDRTLQEGWKQKMEENKFRYKLGQLKTRIIEGELGFVAQLNPERAMMRRKPQELQRVNEPFNPAEFNFTKAPDCETLMFLSSAVDSGAVDNEKSRNPIIINVSPLEFGNSLLVPQIDSKIPQKVTLMGLKMAVDMLLLSGHPGFRVGFNSPGGFASVNHQHYHLYYLNYRLPIETAKITHVKGPCYIFKNYPARGFVFPLEELSRVDDLVLQVFKFVAFLQTQEVPHNLFITRAENHNDVKIGILDRIRICIWAREPSFGAKDDWNFNPALCELGGHLLIKDEDSFNNMTEDQMSSCLRIVTEQQFMKVASVIDEIFT